MTALEAEHVAGGSARCRQLPAEFVCELERCATGGVGGVKDYIPVVGPANLLRPGHCHRPAAQCSGPRIGDAHVHLIEGTSRIGRRRGTAMRRQCLIAQ
jgi:hypothetical protein